MASWRELIRPLRLLRPSPISRQANPRACARRWYAAEGAVTASAPADDSDPLQALDPDEGIYMPEPTAEQLETFREPWKRAKQRKYRLPASRYQYHPPRYNRGELHPIQSPKSSDPVARDYKPGPFYLPRLKETFQTTIASDLLTLTYSHKPPGGQGREFIGERLRSWDGSSPYHKNRPLRGPRGGTNLRPVERDITFRNIPELLAVSLASYVPLCIKDPTYLLAARTALMAITGTRTEMTRVRQGVAQFGVSKGQLAGVKAMVWGEQAYELLDKIVHLVFPRIKDWTGVSFATGDESGNVGWGFTPDQVALFPEIQTCYDMFPAKMIPGCRVNVVTTAKSDRHAKLFLQTMGIPFCEPDANSFHKNTS